MYIISATVILTAPYRNFELFLNPPALFDSIPLIGFIVAVGLIHRCFVSTACLAPLVSPCTLLGPCTLCTPPW